MRAGVARGDDIPSGARNVMLCNAVQRATPATCIAGLFKRGWEAVDRIVYAFFDGKPCTKLNVQRAACDLWSTRQLAGNAQRRAGVLRLPSMHQLQLS